MTSSLSRRTFVQATGAAVLAAALTKSSLGAPLNIIDTHTHFYDPTRPAGVPWPPQDDALLYRRVLPADYRALAKPQPVAGTVVVEASAWLEDNQWILDLAQQERFIVGFVGHLTAGTAEFESNLNRFAKNPLFRGIRISEEVLRKGIGQAEFRRHLEMLSDHDLALDLLGGPELLGDVPGLAKVFPKLRIIIDHVANVRIDGQSVPGPWREGMRATGASPNVFCKVSGLVEGTGRTDGQAPKNTEFYRPVLDAIWDSFGAERLIYGSNWPVSERFAPCAVVQRLATEYFSARGETTLARVLGKNSQAAYKWIDRKG